jgi:hypothetical protein
MQETSRQQGCATVLFKISDETSPVASATPGERQQQALPMHKLRKLCWQQRKDVCAHGLTSN